MGPEGRRRSSLGARVAFGALGFALSGSFYLLLIDITDLPELYAGAAVVLISALVFEAAREQGLAEVGLTAPQLLRLWRPLLRIPRDIALVSLAALAQALAPRASRGSLRAFPFHAGSPTGARDTGRRALAEAAGSLAPNTIVIGIDVERDLILGHQLWPSGGVENVDVLELG